MAPGRLLALLTLALALPVEGEYDTVGGLLLHRLGKVPKAGERLALPGVLLTVTEADERRVKRVKVQVDGATARASDR